MEICVDFAGPQGDLRFVEWLAWIAMTHLLRTKVQTVPKGPKIRNSSVLLIVAEVYTEAWPFFFVAYL